MATIGRLCSTEASCGPPTCSEQNPRRPTRLCSPLRTDPFKMKVVDHKSRAKSDTDDVPYRRSAPVSHSHVGFWGTKPSVSGLCCLHEEDESRRAAAARLLPADLVRKTNTLLLINISGVRFLLASDFECLKSSFSEFPLNLFV